MDIVMIFGIELIFKKQYTYLKYNKEIINFN